MSKIIIHLLYFSHDIEVYRIEDISDHMVLLVPFQIFLSTVRFGYSIL